MAEGIDPALAACFDRPAEALEADGWERLELAAGDRLWRQGDPADSVAWVEAGALQVVVDGSEHGRIGPGELLGEASAFIRGQSRSAEVAAAEPTRLWVLRQARLTHLRGTHVAFYDLLLQVAITTLARRISENEQALSRNPMPPRPRAEGPTLWARFRRHLERPDTPPPAAEALAALPNLPARGVLADDIAAIAEPLWLKTAEALCLEGDPARSMYIVARGALRVMLTARGQALELARIGPGALLGTAALLRDSERTASLVAAEPTWVYELTRERVDRLSAGAWRILAESLLVVMRGQLVRSHQR